MLPSREAIRLWNGQAAAFKQDGTIYLIAAFTGHRLGVLLAETMARCGLCQRRDPRPPSVNLILRSVTVEAAGRRRIDARSQKTALWHAVPFVAMPDRDFLDELVSDRTARNPDFPRKVESYHDRRLARRLEEDSEFRAEFERQRAAIGGMAQEHHSSKAE